jgi:hypothetical protein
MHRLPQTAFREAIERINREVDEAVAAARTAGVSERYISDALRKRLRHYTKPPAPSVSEEALRRRFAQWEAQRAQRYTPETSEQREQRREYQRRAEQQRVEASRQAEKERQAEFELGVRMLKIGYKELAKELHPDKGGSKDAMARLNKAKARLKAQA